MKELLLFICIISLMTCSRDISTYDILEYNCDPAATRKLFSSEEIIIVFPSDKDSLDNQELTIRWREGLKQSGVKCIIRFEDQLLPEDFNKSMLIFGTIGSYKNWEAFKTPIIKESGGFEFGGFSFYQQNDAICYLPDTTAHIMKFVVVGNSTNSLKPIVNNMRDGYNYLIFEDGMITHFGNCTHNEYDELKHVYLPDLKNRYYKLVKTEYYDFHISKRLENQITEYKSKLDSLDFFVNKYIDIMKLNKPTFKITCFIHSDHDEISYISTHFGHLCGGTTYGIITGKEIHSNGFDGAIEHETSHVIFNSEYNDFAPTFFSEGIRQYYDYGTNHSSLLEGFVTAREFAEEDLTSVILGEENFFQGSKYYQISGIFVKYLIDNWNLETFKQFYMTVNPRNIEDSFNETYEIGLGIALRDYSIWLKTE